MNHETRPVDQGSALGYTLVLASTPGLPEVSITVAGARLRAGEVRSSLTFDLPVAHAITAAATFYAADDDALDSLASLLWASATFETGQILLGGPVEEDIEPGVHGLDDHTRVNDALGVLIARGQTFDEAHRHLRRLAQRLGSLGKAAEHLLSTFAA